jgi:hypothetical protein
MFSSPRSTLLIFFALEPFIPAMGIEVYSDDMLVSAKQLAVALLVSRSTIRSWQGPDMSFNMGD